MNLAEILYTLIEKLNSSPGLSGILVFCIQDNEASDGQDKNAWLESRAQGINHNENWREKLKRVCLMHQDNT